MTTVYVLASRASVGQPLDRRDGHHDRAGAVGDGRCGAAQLELVRAPVQPGDIRGVVEIANRGCADRDLAGNDPAHIRDRRAALEESEQSGRFEGDAFASVRTELGLSR